MEGIHYTDKYAPVVAWSTVRMMLCLSLHLNLQTRQVDFSNAFLQSTLKEGIYLEPPAGFEPDIEGSSQYIVLKLNKSLYGLVQSLLH